jgi:hypothetical protein
VTGDRSQTKTAYILTVKPTDPKGADFQQKWLPPGIFAWALLAFTVLAKIKANGDGKWAATRNIKTAKAKRDNHKAQ